jgi:integrase
MMTTMKPNVETVAVRDLEKYTQKIGPSECVRRFLQCYAKVRVQRIYALHLLMYFRWLKKNGVGLSPDELVVDNLRCIYRSEPEDVVKKRKHRALLEDYLNQELGHHSESHRRLAMAAVKGFYERNDNLLFGKVSIAEQQAVVPDRALKADDTRQGDLRALPLAIRTPLLCVWQSSCEINRVLALRWKDLEGLKRAEYPLQLSFYGRRRHRKQYYTFLGRDAIDHLKLWHEKWEEELAGRPPQPDDLVFLGKRGKGMNLEWINMQFRSTALKLAKQGLVENDSPESWHSHMLRHSFKTESEHAGIKSGIVEFWMGHSGGIAQVYDNRDEIHAQDFVEAYKKLEPHVSLDYMEAVMTEQFESSSRAGRRRYSLRFFSCRTTTRS